MSYNILVNVLYQKVCFCDRSSIGMFDRILITPLYYLLAKVCQQYQQTDMQILVSVKVNNNL